MEAGLSGATKRKHRRRRARRIRYALEYFGLRVIRLVVLALPIDAASAGMAWCWRLVAPFLHRHPRVLEHLQMAYPEETQSRREQLAVAMWANLGRVFAESFMIDRLIAAGRVDDQIAPLLAEVKAQNRGIVFVSLHSGNWELVIAPAFAAKIKIAGVYQKVKNPWVDRYLLNSRRERYPRGLFAKGADIGRLLVRITREGGAIAMLADLRDRRGVAVPFFGRPAPSTTFPALLARSNNAVLVAARVVRFDGAHFRVEGEIIDVPRTENRDRDLEEGTRRIQSLFERWIREHPEQWMWAHRRWG
jgi:Kdo2-lipid IVA lauroyltransferase/acyltransferase